MGKRKRKVSMRSTRMSDSPVAVACSVHDSAKGRLALVDVRSVAMAAHAAADEIAVEELS